MAENEDIGIEDTEDAEELEESGDSYEIGYYPADYTLGVIVNRLDRPKLRSDATRRPRPRRA